MRVWVWIVCVVGLVRSFVDWGRVCANDVWLTYIVEKPKLIFVV
jgi:hypothetical protein